MTSVVHCRKDEYDTYIGRPSKWGNPFVIGEDGDRKEVVNKYRVWVLKQPQLLADLSELCGKRLGCWCAPKLCHGDVLAELALIREDGFNPDWVSPPGDSIASILEDRNIPQEDLSHLIGRSVEFTERLMVGAEVIDVPLAEELSNLLGATVKFWLNRDARYWIDKQRLGL